MDQSFLMRASRLLDGRRPAPLDLELLTAAVAARQASSPTARAQACAGGAAPAADADAVAELLLAGPDWRRAATERRGSFSRSRPRREGNFA